MHRYGSRLGSRGRSEKERGEGSGDFLEVAVGELHTSGMYLACLGPGCLQASFLFHQFLLLGYCFTLQKKKSPIYIGINMNYNSIFNLCSEIAKTNIVISPNH